MSYSIVLISVIAVICIAAFMLPQKDIIVHFPFKGKRRELKVAISKLGIYLNTTVSLVSLWIAIAAYLDAQKSGPEQQKTLNDSRKALESVVELTKAQKTAIDSSVAAMRDVSKILGRQYEIVDEQWKEEKAMLSRKPKFDIKAQYKYFYIMTKQDTLRADEWRLDNDKYSSLGEMSPDGSMFPLELSPLFNYQQLSKNVFPLRRNNTREGKSNMRYFYLMLYITNIGQLNAETVYISVKSLRRGVYISGDGITAPEPLMEPNGNVIFSPGVKQVPFLTMYRSTKETITLNLRVSVEDYHEYMGKVTPIDISVFDVKKTSKTDLRLKFIIK